MKKKLKVDDYSRIPDLAAEAEEKAPVPLDPMTGKARQKRFVSTIRAERYWAEEAAKNPLFFHEYMLEKAPAKHHKIWYAHIFSPDYPRLNLIAPPESGKTTVLNMAIAWLIGRAPLLTNAIISVSSEQAESRLRMIRNIVGENPRYKNVFSKIDVDRRHGIPDTQSQFTVLDRSLDYAAWRSIVTRFGSDKDPTLYSAGQGGQGIIGRRISGLMLLDDIIDAKTLTVAAQDQIESYVVQTLVSRLTPNARLINIGTRWMIGDLPQRLSENSAWKTLSIPAIKFDKEGGRYSYWPEHWPLQRIDDRRTEMKNDVLFNTMYMANALASSANLFNKADLSQDLPNPINFAFKGIYIVVDSAVSQRNYADWNVYQAWGEDQAGNFYLLDMIRFKAEPDDIVERLVKFANKILFIWHKLNFILFENAGFQAFFRGIFSKKYPGLPVESAVPAGDKGHRATLVSELAKTGKLFINQHLPDLSVLQSEWMNFPLYPHDDTLDPIGLLLQHLSSGISFVEMEYVKSVYLL